MDGVVAQRRREADAFYAEIHPPKAQRGRTPRATAGLGGDALDETELSLRRRTPGLRATIPNVPPPESRKDYATRHWRHLNSMRVLTMPDKWEYPWFAAWDLAFQCLPLALVDPEFAKEQLWVLLFEQFMHANGQIPAYEWEFSDLNPPVHAWAVWRVYNMDRMRTGRGDRMFLEKCFHKLLINFAWWVNRVDAEGNNVFEGGFLGLDNITVVDRSEKTARRHDAEAVRRHRLDGHVLSEPDAHRPGTGAREPGLSRGWRPSSSSTSSTSARRCSTWASATSSCGARTMASSTTCCAIRRLFHKFRVRSLVGLIPLYAVERLSRRRIAAVSRVPGQSWNGSCATASELDAVVRAAPWTATAKSPISCR